MARIYFTKQKKKQIEIKLIKVELLLKEVKKELIKLLKEQSKEL